MKTAAELLDVIEASHLPTTPRLQEDRAAVLALVDECFESASINSESMAVELSQSLVEHGVVYGEVDQVQGIVEAYLQVVASADSLNREEMDFLNSFLD